MTDANTPPIRGFADFPLDERILRALNDLGFESPTPIQAHAIPVLLEGRDVIGRARTGSGKTAAYAIPMLQRLSLPGNGVRALILAPTRELAQQVESAVADLARHLKMRTITLYGGAPFGPQLSALRRGVSVVVGTPGRTLDLLDKGHLDLSNLEVAVLDEADEMLRMGFIEDVERILSATPKTRQVALLSATMPDDIRRIARGHLHDPVGLQMDDDGPQVDHIQQSWMRVPQRQKLESLHRLLLTGPPGATVVFARTRAGCAEVADALARLGIPADALHGDLNQTARERVVERLRSGATRVVVATDVAARGLDVEHIDRVVNLDMPEDVESYVHRIGRTARAGREGEAITFATAAQRRRIGGIEKSLGVTIRKAHVPDDADIAAHRQALLRTALVEAAAGPAFDYAHAWVSKQVEDGWSLPDLAASAIAQLAAVQDIDLRPPDQVPSPPPTRDRDDRRDRQDRGGSQGRDDRRARRDQDAAVPDDQHVQVFFAIGDRHGVGPGDLVGCLANEAGLPAGALGRIDIQHRKSFVAMPPALAEDLLGRYKELEIRGNAVRISRARGGRGRR